jgi:hypothetical protein
MGLGVDLNLFVEPGDTVEPCAGLSPDRGDSISTFTHFRELPDWLESGEFELVYTETYRDERIQHAGKTPIALHHLHPGFLGALRSIRNVNAALAAGFNRRFRKYFPNPYSHFRNDSESRART